ncbi:hypothetical protein DPMN_122061 [Dreissena polymorpha]|uniref:Uncharacterized protein n=1 Tax=Dreissena polymorpha TaxID=45954 RepID=A0A9D4GNN6_DREPO|nr:hypothetical protein DPMN_122061 [Dreissena polymorpha]
MIERRQRFLLTPRSHKDASSTTIKAWPKTWPIATNRRSFPKRMMIALYAFATLILNMLKTSVARSWPTRIMKKKKKNSDRPRSAPYKPFSDRGLIGMIVVKSQFCENGG